jgi:hypothetical protein
VAARPTTALAATLLAGLAIAACGGSDDEYGDDFRPVSEQIVSLGQEVGDTIQRAGESTDEELAGDFEDFANELGDLRQELADLDPPDELDDEQDALVAAMGEVRSSLEDIAEAAEQRDAEAASQATVELVQRSSELRDTRQRLAAAVREL